MSIRKVTKALAGKEDLLLGNELHTQQRGNQEVVIKGLSGEDIPRTSADSETVGAALDRAALTVETIEDFPTTDLVDGQTVVVRDLNRGGIFIYDSSKVAEDNQGTNFNGWIRQYEGSINVDWFGANETRTDNEIPIQMAWAVSPNIEFKAKVYQCGTLVLAGNVTNVNKIIKGNNAVIQADAIIFSSMFSVNMSNITFKPEIATYIEGMRYSKLTNVTFQTTLKVGNHRNGTASSYSFYWNNFDNCKIQGLHFKLCIANANANSNSFSQTEFRVGNMQALMTFEKSGPNAPFSGNTFISCDMSYAPVFYLIDKYSTFAITIIGGYLDTGTPWYHEDSFKVGSLDIIGLRNPSGTAAPIGYNASMYITSGGARPSLSVPTSSLSLFKEDYRDITLQGNRSLSLTSRPLPVTGQYSVSSSLAKNVAGGDVFDGIYLKNVTQDTTMYGVLNFDGYDSYTFKANKGDVIKLTYNGSASTDTTLEMVTLTKGAGVFDAIPYTKIHSQIIKTDLVADTDTVLFTKTVKAYSTGTIDFRIKFRTSVVGGGFRAYDILIPWASGGSKVAHNLQEITNISVDGVGGTSDDAPSVTFTLSSTDLDLTLEANASKDCSVEIIDASYSI